MKSYGMPKGAADLQVSEEITEALVALRDQAPEAMDRLMPLVYDQLRQVAHRQLCAEPTGHTLSTTALVHEAYLKLVDQTRVQWQDRAHFFALASRAMRRILVDYARRHRAVRRGGLPDGTPPTPVSLDEVKLPVEERAEARLALDEALDRLGQVDGRLAQVVECRFFAGLTEAEGDSKPGRASPSLQTERRVVLGLRDSLSGTRRGPSPRTS